MFTDPKEELQIFYENLPDKPYYADESFNRIIRKKKHFSQWQKESKYIQAQSPFIKNYIIVDYDKDSLDLIPTLSNAPNLVFKNKDDNRAHLLFRLNTGVYSGENSSKIALSYYNDTADSLTHHLQGDPAYNRLLTKNPFNTSLFDVFSCTNKAYELAELNFGKVAKPRKTNADEVIDGRNDHLFNSMRKIAYSMKNIDKNISQSELYDRLFSIAKAENASFDNPLQHNEIRHIVKSISKWVYENYTPQWNRGVLQLPADMPLKEKQSKAATYMHDKRKSATREKIDAAIRVLKLREEKITQKAVAEQAKVSLRTVKSLWIDLF